MNESQRQRVNRISWRLGVLAALAMAFLALIPQLHLWVVRGSDWQGTYASFDFDEVAYSSYLSALIAGRPRRNDPYTGRDDEPGKPQTESLHSIQFVPGYVAAIPARLLGLSVASTFILIRVFAAIAATLAIFWLLVLMTRDEQLAACGAIVVLCLGGVAGEPNEAWKILTFRWRGESLPFLRRYVPAMVFPLFFLFVAFVWQALQSRTTKARLGFALSAGLSLAILIFSYFFLWTTAVAWLLVIAPLWLIARREQVRTALLVFAVIAISAAVALVPYAVLLSQRAPTIDAAQLLTRSRAIIFSPPVVIGFIVFAALAVAARRRWLNWRDPAVLFTASFALLPAVTFNQQIVTGLLLQPVHYSRYSSNYISVLAGVLTIALCLHVHNLSRRTYSRLVALVGVTVITWAVFENGAHTYRLASHHNSRDDARRVAWRLRDLAPSRPATASELPVVFCSDLSLADALPNEAQQPVLWASHLFVFSGTTANENRERLYRQLYYSGVGEQEFRQLAGSSSFVQLAIFGWERMHRKPYTEPITAADVEKETQLYAEYIENFDAAKAASPRLAFVVIPALGGPSLSVLDRWYIRDAGERVSDFLLYRVTLRE